MPIPGCWFLRDGEMVRDQPTKGPGALSFALRRYRTRLVTRVGTRVNVGLYAGHSSSSSPKVSAAIIAR